MNLAKEGMFLDHRDPRAGEPREVPTYTELPDSLQAAFEELFDYAGFAPPAETDPRDVIRYYGEYAAGPQALMLRRLVQRALYIDKETGEQKSDLDILDGMDVLTIPAGYDGYSALIMADPIEDPDLFGESIVKIALSGHSEDISAVEFPVNSVASVSAVTDEGFTAFDDKALFLEVQTNNDMAAILDAIAKGREMNQDVYAKLRTGGKIPPTFDETAKFMVECARRGIPYKLTGRLHGLLAHTNKDDGVRESGYLNAVLASVLASSVAAGQMDESVVLQMLEEDDIGAFKFTDDEIVWKDRVIPTAIIRIDDYTGLYSIGSCSFEEPVEELARLRPAA